jgi:nitrate reductase (NAD(P)H)
MGLNVGGHIFFHIKVGGDTVSRKYTPVSPVNKKGVVEFVIKVYKPTDEFPKGGVMSQHLDSMKVGEKLKMEGPKGMLYYFGNGNFELRKKLIKKTKIGLIAGGTGITPCYQIIQAATLAKDQT